MFHPQDYAVATYELELATTYTEMTSEWSFPLGQYVEDEFTFMNARKSYEK